MGSLELKVPPPVVGLLIIVLMGLTAATFPEARFDLPGHHLLASGLALAGIAIAVSGVGAFRRVGTTMNPMNPATASALVQTGIFRFTRNPMYLGVSIVLVAWGVELANLAAGLLIPVFVLYIGRFQIRPEERALVARFGQAYEDYKAKVRRWL